jgi:DNA-binding NarL/FixJ family response regulator/tetratricopeptide (TPR) repeat protein
VHVVAEPGGGKTALLRASVATADVDVVWCSADQLGQHQSLDALTRGLALSSTPNDGDGAATTDAILTAFRLRLDRGPVALVIDDVHWCDNLTFRLLPRLATEFRDRPLVILTSGHRSLGSESWRLLSSLSSCCPTTEVVLPPLSRTDSAALVRWRLDGQTPGEPEQWWRKSAGNPQLLLLLADVAKVDQGGAVVLPPARVPTRQIPHLARVSPGCLRLLELAAVLGEEIDARQLVALNDIPLAEVLAHLDEAISKDVLEEADALRFRHEVVRESLALEVSASIRGELHRRAARDLTETGGDAVRAARHLLSADLSVGAHDWVRAVGDGCVVVDPDRAIALWRHYRASARFTGVRDRRRVEVDIQIALALLSSGRARAAELAAREIFERDGVSSAPLINCLEVALMLQGKYTEARAIAQSAGTADTLHPWERAEQTALAGTAALLEGDATAATGTLDHASGEAAITGSAIARMRVLVARGHLEHRRGELEKARLLLQEAARLCEEEDSRAAHETFMHGLFGLVLADQGRADEAAAAFLHGEESGRACGSTIASRFATVCRALSDTEAGRLEEAIAAIDVLLAAEDQTAPLWQAGLLARRALAALYTEGPDAAEQWLARLTERDWRASEEYGMAWRPRAAAAVRLARGDTDDALSTLWCAWQEIQAAGVLIDTRLLATELVDASRRARDAQKAWVVVDSLEDLASRNQDVRSLEVQVLTVRGMLTDDCDLLMSATELASGISHRMVAARAAEEAAIALIAVGKAEDAREVSRAALEGYGAAGAAFESARARAAFRRAGIRVRESARVRPRRGWEALTPAELIVARHVERGMSNAEISDELVVSRRTVESHVSHILAKLGVRSRADLILAAVRDGSDG